MICKVSGHRIGEILMSVAVSMIKVLPLFVLLMVFDSFVFELHLILTLVIKSAITFFYFIAAIYFGLYNDIPLPVCLVSRLKHNQG